MNSRRDFIKKAGLLTGAALILKPDWASAKPIGKLGIQLYTLRNEIQKDVKGVIKKVAAAGYKQVETFGYNKQNGFWGLSAKEFSDLLKDNGLTSPSGHYDFGSYFSAGDTSALQSYLEAGNILGQEYILVPYIDNALISTEEKCKSIAGLINKAGEICKKEGLLTGYHNHDFEWKPLGSTNFYNILLAQTDPELVKMELDLYWVVRSRLDPVDIFKANKGRFKLVHVKDMDKTQPNRNTEVGTGSIDFKRILPEAKKAGVKYFIVEQENFSKDSYESITESYRYVSRSISV